jgi:hypothetical protein
MFAEADLLVTNSRRAMMSFDVNTSRQTRRFLDNINSDLDYIYVYLVI